MRVSHASQLNDDSKLISMMSPMIEGEVAVATNRRWLNRVWYFRDLDSSMEGRYFTVALAKKLVIRAYMATERLPIGQLYILRRGLCVKMWRFLGGGHTWGEDIILDNAELVDHSQAVALTYLECFTLRRNDMEEALAEVPAVQHVVRRAARKLSMQRALIRHLVGAVKGRTPLSFVTQSAARGCEAVSASLTVAQKLDEINGRLRSMEQRQQHGRGGHAAVEASVHSSVASPLHVESPIKVDRVEPWVEDTFGAAEGRAAMNALEEEVSDLKTTVSEMQRVMLSELKAMKELINNNVLAQRQ